MACGTCGHSGLLNKLANSVQKVLGSSGTNSTMLQVVPRQVISGDDSNVYGNPTHKISSHGTNAKLTSGH